jgi:hypothetical protein
MTVRIPLKYISTASGFDLQEFSSADLQSIYNRAKWLYSSNKSVTLSFQSTNGNLGRILESRMLSGESAVDPTNYDTEAETTEPYESKVAYHRIQQTIDNTTSAPDVAESADDVGFPLYYDSNTGDIKAMTKQDFYDTFITPAITDFYTTASYGKYNIWNASTRTGWTALSSTPVYVDTVSDLASFDSDGIQATDGIMQSGTAVTQTEYFLLEADTPAASYINGVGTPVPVTAAIGGSGDLETNLTRTDTLLQTGMRHGMAHGGGSSNNKLRYYYNGIDPNGSIDGYSGTGGYQQGVTMVNQLRTGEGRYVTMQTGLDDYRSQEFPSGAPVTNNTHTLRLDYYRHNGPHIDDDYISYAGGVNPGD